MERHAGPQPVSPSDPVRNGLSANLLTRVIEATSAEIYLFEPATLKILEMSRGALTNLHYSLDEVREMTPLELMPSLDPADLEAMLDRLRDSSETETRFEQVCRRNSGSTYSVAVQIRLIPDDERSLFFAEVNDLTEKRSVDHQLRQAQKVDATAQLTGGVAHDFNNFLQVILGNLDLLLWKPDLAEERQRHHLEAALNAARRGAELTHNLSLLARREPLGPRRVDVSLLVSQTQEVLRRSIDDSIEVDTALTDDLWITTVDVAQLESALINLVVNAQGAMPSGGKITITTENVLLNEEVTSNHPGLGAGAYAMLAVTDSGNGMAPAVRERAFEPFFTTKPVGEGTGLGLAMVYGFCEQSGGGAIITSEEGLGTTVAMYLPRASDPLDPAT